MGETNYLAHIAEDGREETVDAHLEAVARLSETFAAAFDSAEYGRLVGLAHDIGKNSDAFQRRLRNNGPKVDHATAGAVECAKVNAVYAACCVIGHHSGLPDFGNVRIDQPGDHTFAGRVKKGITGGIPSYQWIGQLPSPGPLPVSEKDDYALSFWVRMLYSCLVDADYLATEAFMTGNGVSRGGWDPLPVLLDKLEAYIQTRWSEPKTEVDRLRCGILQNCREAAGGEPGLYTLTVPTGGGKTVSSLAFALRHAVHHGMKRAIYIIPYTSIIEQNAAVFREILGERNVVEHHSGASFDGDEEINGKKSFQRLAAENWDAPVIVTTAVQFFESLYGSRSSQCRKLHNLAGSVLIFDEAQLLPAGHLQVCVGGIVNLVTHFHATAVLCTATQPALGDLIHSYDPALTVREICPNVQQLYEQFRRVTFRRGGKLTNEALAEELKACNQVLCVVNTRKTAQELFALLPAGGRFHLSTLMYPAHRTAILDEVRRRLKEGLPCRVVSTSLIEAGVDVSFPSVYRELSGLDSLCQAAGRCNRNGTRPAKESVVTWFEGETAAPPLMRIHVGAAKETLAAFDDPGDPEAIRRYFTAYRSLLGQENLDKAQVVRHLKEGYQGCRLPFEMVARDFHFIDQATKTVYLPLGRGDALCQALRSPYVTRETYRKAGQYSVSIYGSHYQALLEAGDLEILDENSGILVNLEQYDPEKGLSLKTDTGRAVFV